MKYIQKNKIINCFIDRQMKQTRKPRSRRAPLPWNLYSREKMNCMPVGVKVDIHYMDKVNLLFI